MSCLTPKTEILNSTTVAACRPLEHRKLDGYRFHSVPCVRYSKIASSGYKSSIINMFRAAYPIQLERHGTRLSVAFKPVFSRERLRSTRRNPDATVVSVIAIVDRLC